MDRSQLDIARCMTGFEVPSVILVFARQLKHEHIAMNQIFDWTAPRAALWHCKASFPLGLQGVAHITL